jgi:hypothetical protein
MYSLFLGSIPHLFHSQIILTLNKIKKSNNMVVQKWLGKFKMAKASILIGFNYFTQLACGCGISLEVIPLI